MITPEQALATIHKRFGAHAGFRALHAKGTLCEGTFTPTPKAATLTRAAHMQGEPVPVIARLSNGDGHPRAPDYEPDVRGLAVSFGLADGSRTDIVAQSAPRFPFRDADTLMRFLELSKPALRSALGLPPFLIRNPSIARALPANLGALKPPASYATIPYYAVHAFRWLDRDGGGRYVRYTWEPEASAPSISRGEAKGRGRDYLQEELAERLGEGPIRFGLALQIAGPDDPSDDPSAAWPADRETALAGTLELSATTTTGDEMVFDPMRLTDGIEPSKDPILHFRPRAYSLSHEARTASS